MRCHNSYPIATYFICILLWTIIDFNVLHSIEVDCTVLYSHRISGGIYADMQLTADIRGRIVLITFTLSSLVEQLPGADL